jgi:hypothetical protein
MAEISRRAFQGLIILCRLPTYIKKNNREKKIKIKIKIKIIIVYNK